MKLDIVEKACERLLMKMQPNRRGRPRHFGSGDASAVGRPTRTAAAVEGSSQGREDKLCAPQRVELEK